MAYLTIRSQRPIAAIRRRNPTGKQSATARTAAASSGGNGSNGLASRRIVSAASSRAPWPLLRRTLACCRRPLALISTSTTGLPDKPALRAAEGKFSVADALDLALPGGQVWCERGGAGVGRDPVLAVGLAPQQQLDRIAAAAAGLAGGVAGELRHGVGRAPPPASPM